MMDAIEMNNIFIRPLNAELRKIAATELNEVESRLPQDIIKLSEWLKQQPHIKARHDVDALLAFLRGCKHSLEKAKTKMELFYTILQCLPEFTHNLQWNDKFLDICLSGVFVELPKPLHTNGPRMYFSRLSQLDMDKHHLYDLFRFQAMFILGKTLTDDQLLVAGSMVIIDAANISIKPLKQLDFPTMKKLLCLGLKGAPVRFKGLHVINLPNHAVTLWLSFKAFIGGKLSERIEVHRTVEDFHKIVPKVYLPIEYGGENGSLSEISKETAQILAKHQDEYPKLSQYGINEKLRPANSKIIDIDKFFGLEGSFRKLEID